MQSVIKNRAVKKVKKVFFEILLDSLLDTLKILPVIFVVYVLIEFIETREGSFKKLEKAFSSRFSVLFGAGIGVVPQCGFSVVATRLFQDGYIYIGTLIAVYLATSDEAVPIMFSRAVVRPELWIPLVLIIAIKVVYAAGCGFLINLTQKTPLAVLNDDKHIDEHTDGCCHHDITGERKGWKKILLHPLFHSLKIALYIFIINVAFGSLVQLVIGEAALESFMHSSVYLQPLISCVVGLIPNCASSVLITELYFEGALSFGGVIAGLAVNSGIGMAVLFKDRKNLKRAFTVVGLTFALALLLGYAVTAVEILL